MCEYNNHVTSPTNSSEDVLPFLTFDIDENRVFDGALQVLARIRGKWAVDDIRFKVFTEGYTNKLVACMHKDDVDTKNDVVLVRIYGRGTSLMINRDQERASMVIFNKIGCAAPLYCRFNNGIAYGYTPGIVLNIDLIHRKNIQKLVAREMVRIHSVDANSVITHSGDGIQFDSRPSLFVALNKWIDYVPTKFDDLGKQKRLDALHSSRDELKEEIDLLERELSCLGSPVVFCHNDLLFKNIIYDADKEKVTFIDFEYVAFNYQAFDIANHFCEFAGMEEIDFTKYPDKTYQMEWLETFLRFYYEQIGRNPKEVTDVDVETLYVQVNKFALACHIFWAVWGLIQSHHSTIDYDYLDFARARLAEYRTRKDEFLSLKIPSST